MHYEMSERFRASDTIAKYGELAMRIGRLIELFGDIDLNCARFGNLSLETVTFPCTQQRSEVIEMTGKNGNEKRR